MHGSNRIGFSIWQWNRGHLLQDESSDCPPRVKVELIVYSLGYNLEDLRNQPLPDGPCAYHIKVLTTIDGGI